MACSGASCLGAGRFADLSVVFSGLVPQIMGEVIVVFGSAALMFAAERAIVLSGMYEKQGEKSVKVCFLHKSSSASV